MSVIRWTFAISLSMVALSSAVVRAEEETAAPASQPAAAAAAVDFRRLKEMMPEELVGLKRTDNSGEKISMGEYKVSVARADYGKENDESENPPSINVEVTDFGATPSMGEAMAVWAKLDIDQEGDDGYQKTVKYADQPGMENFQTDGKHGTLQIYVANRYIISITTSNLDAENLKKIAEAYPLKKLAELK